MAETVLVTGGTGFVGGWSIVELLKQGYNVRTTVRGLAKEPSLRKAVATEVDAGSRLKVFAADLTADDGWDQAMQGVDYVWHIASPLGGTALKDPNELIVPAREGTIRVLRTAQKAKVKRTIVTSSTAASSAPIAGPDSINDETMWTDPKAKGINAYRQSKAIAERAAWDFMSAQGAKQKLTTVLPTGVFGPVLTAEGLGSVQIVQRLLKGQVPRAPRLGFCVVDVRDVVDAHLRAMRTPAAAGERFIAGGDFMWMIDVARALREELGDAAKKVPKGELPNFMVRFAALFDPALRELTPTLGKKHIYKNDKAKRVLGWAPRPAKTAMIDCAKSLIEKGAV